VAHLYGVRDDVTPFFVGVSTYIRECRTLHAVVKGARGEVGDAGPLAQNTHPSKPEECGTPSIVVS
jgi:hypothetical protein